MTDKPFYTWKCGSCGEGVLEIMRDVDTGEPVVTCDDCELQWSSIEAGRACGSLLDPQRSRLAVATEEEVERWGWRAQVIRDD